nr:hypothetical protein Iba_chr06cCG9840 [Ipomoea batatas]
MAARSSVGQDVSGQEVGKIPLTYLDDEALMNYDTSINQTLIPLTYLDDEAEPPSSFQANELRHKHKPNFGQIPLTYLDDEAESPSSFYLDDEAESPSSLPHGRHSVGESLEP